MKNKQWTRIFHVALLLLLLITLTLVVISSSNIYSKYITDLKETKQNNLYGNIIEVNDWDKTSDTIEYNKTTTYTHDIDESMIGNYLVFFSYHSTVKASLVDNGDKQLIYQLSTDTIFKRSTSNNVNFIKIPLDVSDKTIEIEMKGCYDNIVYPEIKFLCGEKYDFLMYYIYDDIVNISVELAMFIFSIVICIVSIMCLKYKSSVLDMLYLGLFMLTFSLWCLSGSKVIHVLFQQPVRILYINYFNLYLTPLFLLLYIRGKTYGHNIKKSTLTYTILAHIILIAAIELLQLFNIKDIRETISYLHIMLVFEVLLVFRYNITRIHSNESISLKDFLKSHITLGMILVTVIIAIIQYAFTSVINPALLCIAIIIYVTNLVLETIRDLYQDILIGQQSKELREIAYTDSLTNIKNRNAFISDTKDIELDELVIIAFDLNSLKYYNDNFGHDKGDKLIIGMAEILKKVFGDRAYRIGGDEFEVVIYDKGINIDSLLLRFEQEEKKFNADNKDGIKIRAAYGYCKYDGQEGHDINYMINTADKRMYEHKKYLKNFR